jgi:RecA-family ATPase
VSAGSLSVLIGESGAGKSFAALDLAACVGADLDWHGRRVRHGSALYVPFEGHAGLRLRALRAVGGFTLEHVYVMPASAPLSPVVDRAGAEVPGHGERFAERTLVDLTAHLSGHGLPPLALVIVDTVRASLAGSEESSENVSAYLRAIRRLMLLTPGAGWLLLHHAGCQDGEQRRKRERGSSSFRGNVDVSLYLEARPFDPATGTASLTLSTLKDRDYEPLPPLGAGSPARGPA